MTMPPKSEWIKVDLTTIRQLFEIHKFNERMEQGEFSETIKYNKHKSYPDRPHCTHSQVLKWIDKEGRQAAVVHRLYHPTVQTYYDPKSLLIDGAIYFLQP
jgi:hypothetical protein